MSKLLSALTSLTLGGSAAVLLLALLGRSSYRARWRCWAWAGIAHLRFLRHLRRWAKPVHDPETVQLFQWTADRLELERSRRPALLVCPELPAPMLAGVFRPVLLLPAVLEEREDLRFALLHELTHFRRRDILLKALALAANALHWFNPLMWYMVRLVDRDLELACDEDILKCLDAKDYAAYGRAILAASERPLRSQVAARRPEQPFGEAE